MMAVAQVVEIERAVFSEVGDPLEAPVVPQVFEDGPGCRAHSDCTCPTELEEVKHAPEDPETDPVGYTAAIGQAD
ncbi:hypothetical protein E4K10_49945 [Streptomyces sp. T1317-0309]|nr:hypothetical protein E4K10_49945 [Streptomyces sp. T1317-0309]